MMSHFKFLVSFCFVAMLMFIPERAKSNTTEKCPVFNGARYVTVPLNMNNYSTLTFSAWVYVGNNSGYSEIFSNDNGDFDRALHAFNGSEWYIFNDAMYSTGVSVTKNVWQYITVVFTPSYTKFYIDGELKWTGSGSSVLSGASSTYFGGYSYGFVGNIDEVSIWSDERTQEEIQSQMYNYQTSGEAGLLAYYKMNEGTGSTLADDSGNGLTATYYGTGWTNSYAMSAPKLKETSNISYYSFQANWSTNTIGLTPTYYQILVDDNSSFSSPETIIVYDTSYVYTNTTGVSGYYYKVAAYNSSVQLSPYSPTVYMGMPIIETQIEGGDYCVGSSPTLEVTVAGSDLSYTWYKNYAEFTGNISNAIYFGYITTAINGSYYCVISNSYGSVSTDTVEVTANEEYDETAVLSGSGTITYGDEETISISDIVGDIQYWQRKYESGSWEKISETSSSYTETPDASGSWYYRVLTNNKGCTDYSDTYTLSVDQRSLTLSDFSADDKEYDGTTSVTGTGFSDDRLSGDELTITFEAAFSDKNAGTDKTVSYSNITISDGEDMDNYTLSSNTGSTTASITAKSLTLSDFSAGDKEYDGTTSVLESGFSDNRITDDELEFSYSVAFADKNVGTDITVNFNNIAISDGADMSNYSLASTTGSATANITSKVLTITADNQTKTVNMLFTFDGDEFTSDGLVAGDEISSVTITSEGAAADAALGNYNIIISNADGTGIDNYTITYNYGIMYVIEQIIPEITWSNPSDITYGTALGSEQLNATTVTTGTFTYTPADGTILSVGDGQTLSVVFTPDDTDEYTSNTASVTINVTKAELSISVEDESVLTGSDIPDFTITYSGFVNNEDESVLDTLPTATCEATSESEAGTYEIVVSGGADSSYVMTYTNGTLTITTESGLDETVLSAVSVYPNPVSDLVNISLTELSGITTYKLVSVTGKLIKTGTIENGAATIDMSVFNSGVYFLNIIQDNKETGYKIVKE